MTIAEAPSLPEAESQPKGPRQQRPRTPKREVNGWLVLDKPVGMTSTHAVAVVKRLFQAKKAGHAGTLDPLASGLLPIALGEATKTVPFVMEGRKAYQFTVAWGAETDTDDADGTVVERSDSRPERTAVEALLPRFVGEIEQIPPRFSALKIAGERAYDLAREGQIVELAPRTVIIDRLAVIEATPDSATFEAECGKGTYVRAIARDLGRALGCFGHVSALRRTAVGPFRLDHAVTVEVLEELAAAGRTAEALQPVDIALEALPAISVGQPDAQRLLRGQSVLLRGRDAPVMEACTVAVRTSGRLLALADLDRGTLHPRRLFDLRREAAAREAQAR